MEELNEVLKPAIKRWVVVEYYEGRFTCWNSDISFGSIVWYRRTGLDPDECDSDYIMKEIRSRKGKQGWIIDAPTRYQAIKLAKQQSCSLKLLSLSS